MIQEKHFNYYFTKKREFESQKTPVQKLFHFISVAVRLSQVFKLQPPRENSQPIKTRLTKCWSIRENLKRTIWKSKIRKNNSKTRDSRWKWNYLEMIWGLKLIFGNCFKIMIVRKSRSYRWSSEIVRSLCCFMSVKRYQASGSYSRRFF